MFQNYLEQVRAQSPIIHNITNYVTINDVANMLLACGARPIMSDEPSDIQEITAGCEGLNINLGMLNQQKRKSIFLACETAQEFKHAMVLDPVGIGASSFRRKTAEELLDQFAFTAIRGNLSEIKTLYLGEWKNSGVDADRSDVILEENLDQTISMVQRLAKRYQTVVVVSGALDLVCDGSRCFVIQNGRKEMNRITGTGCQLSGLLTAFLAANPKDIFPAAAAAVCAMGLAGEIGWSHMQIQDGNATYRNRIIDAMYHMTGEQLEKGAIYELR